MRILLIAGGWSGEREVSLSGAAQIEQSLRGLGHAVELFDLRDRFDELMDAAQAVDFVFINLHGSPGEDGLVQAMLERAGCPYQGTGPAGSFLALNKLCAKQILRRAGHATPDWRYLTAMPEPGYEPGLGYPLFVKPVSAGSSLAMTRVTSPEELPAAAATVFAAHDLPLLEAAVPGVEITCAVLGDRALPPILIRPRASDVFFDYASKYQVGGAEEICPAPVSDAICRKVMHVALDAHRLLGLAGYSRSDFILEGGIDGEPWFLEVNTLPGMTPTSLLPKAAAAAGLDFAALLAELIELGLARHAGKA